ncbi:helix-turn-helix domain-containing protein [Comamonas sp. J-3]
MDSEPLLSGHIQSATDLGKLAKQRRKAQKLTQADIAGLGDIGLRFVGELERGKGTVQLDKVIHLLDLLGLDLVVVERTGRLKR